MKSSFICGYIERYVYYIIIERENLYVNIAYKTLHSQLKYILFLFWFMEHLEKMPKHMLDNQKKYKIENNIYIYIY